MDGTAPIIVEREADPLPADLLADAERILGGRMRWEGRVRGAFGLIDRRFVINSEGRVESGILHFHERLEFDDGVSEERHWRVGVNNQTITLSADGVELIQPARLTAGGLELIYNLKIGGIKFRYDDVFVLAPNGIVRNQGRASFWSIPVLKVEAAGTRS